MSATSPGDGQTTAERELRDVREQFAATKEILSALGRSGTDPDSVLDTIVARAAALCRADAAQLYLVRGDRFDLSRVSGPTPQGFLDYVREHPVMVEPVVAARPRGAGPPYASRSPTCWPTRRTAGSTCSASAGYRTCSRLR